MVGLKEKKHVITKVFKIHPMGTSNICSEFHGNLSNSCKDISVWTKGLTDLAIPTVMPLT